MRGPLESRYLQVRPGATTGLDLCRFFEAHPDRWFTHAELKTALGCSHRIIREHVPEWDDEERVPMATSITESTAGGTGRLLRPRELSELLGVPVGTLANWRSARTGPPFVKVGRYVRYRTGDVDEWIAARVFVAETVTPHR